MDWIKIAARVALRFCTASALEDVSKLRFQAVFMMGAAGSGKGFQSRKWLKYMPGGGSKGIDYNNPQHQALLEKTYTELERSLSNLTFEKARDSLARDWNIRIEPVKGGKARIPFRLYVYKGSEKTPLDPKDWKDNLPTKVFKQVEGLKDVIFAAPKVEVPSFWRQVNPDDYKKELAGYADETPGYVHELSSNMSKAYFEAIIETGDPIFVDGTGGNLKKMVSYLGKAKAAGYRTTLCYVAVPLVVNQIRNLMRKRNVHPDVVIGQWRRIPVTFSKLKGLADKSIVLDARAPRFDVASYRANADRINTFIRDHTSFDSLYDLIAEHSPADLRDWGKTLKHEEDFEEEAKRKERFLKVEEKRRKKWLKDNPDADPDDFPARDWMAEGFRIARRVAARASQSKPS